MLFSHVNCDNLKNIHFWFFSHVGNYGILFKILQSYLGNWCFGFAEIISPVIVLILVRFAHLTSKSYSCKIPEFIKRSSAKLLYHVVKLTPMTMLLRKLVSYSCI